MKKLLPLLIGVITLFSLTVQAQGELPVNMYTGSPIITVPIHSISAPGLSENISLVYNSGGVKVGAPSGEYGVNWSLNAGGSISREVRGLPDDYSRDGTAITARKGWLYLNASSTTVAADIGALPNTSDLSDACPNADETADYAKLNGLGPVYDTEPDLFSYSAGEYSGKFVFDNGSTPQIRLIPYQDISIVPGFLSATDKTIVNFTLTTNTGDVYFFNTTEVETRWTQIYTIDNDMLQVESEYYKASTVEGALTYNTTWLLTKAFSPFGGEINYGYSSKSPIPVPPPDIEKMIKVKVRKENSTTYKTENIYVDHTTRGEQYLSAIRVPWGTLVNFVRTGDVISTINISDARDADHNQYTTKFVKKFELTYSTGSPKILNSVQEISGSESFPPYKFGYWGYPRSNTNGQDFWGYFNGKTTNTDLFPKLYVYPNLPADERFRMHAIPGYTGDTLVLAGANRDVDVELVKSGSLNSITWPWGGATSIEYEPNQYYDPVAGTDIYGGGIRIKSTTYLDGTNPDARIKKEFTYRDSLGHSSGVLITKPVFIIPLYEYRGTYTLAFDDVYSNSPAHIWKSFTARTATDISSQQGSLGSAVGYREVKVFREGSGYAHYEYELPAATPTQVKIARAATCFPGNIFSNLGSRAYPHARDPDIDFKRGLVKRKREYDNAGNIVRQISTTYQDIFKQGSTPHTVSGVKYDRVPNGTSMFLFGKYAMETDAAKVVATETIRTFDASNISKQRANRVSYFYESNAHKLLTRMESTDAEGNRQTKKLKYPLDYGTIPANPDIASSMINRLQTAGQNGIPVEELVIVKRSGGTEQVVAASVTKFSDFGTARALPQFSYQWSAPDALDETSFVKSNVSSSGVFTIDPGYRLAGTYLAYDSLDKPSANIGRDSIPVTTVWSTKLGAPVATVVNALPGQFAVSDFEAGTEASFDVQEDAPDMEAPYRGPTARSGEFGLYAEVKLSKTITRASNTYRLTGWWNKFASQVTLNVSVKDQEKTTTYYNQSHVVTKSSLATSWDYFSIDIPVASASSVFYMEVSFTFSGTPVQGVMPYIDDFAFYPKQAVLTSQTYQFPFGTTSTTSEEKSGFVEYDNLGRVKYILDQDKNIVQKKTYQFSAN
jgi:hypothetical protein